MPQLVSVRLDEKPSEEMKSAMSDDVRQIMEAHRTVKEKQIEGSWQGITIQEMHCCPHLAQRSATIVTL